MGPNEGAGQVVKEPRSILVAIWRMASPGYRRWPPKVRECGSFPSRAQRVTVFGDT
jgi:hypothetical protein